MANTAKQISNGMNASAEKKFLNALLLIPGAGYHTMFVLRNFFPSYKDAFSASKTQLLSAGIEEKIAEEIIRKRPGIDPDREMERLEREGVRLLEQFESAFPLLLKEIPSPPLWLYIKGKVEPEEEIVAIVGSRKATSYGKEATERIVSGLGATTRVSVASGLAAGIDGEAHRSALRHGLRTLAVVGSGLDERSLFPPQHISLSREITARGGVVISEYPLGMPAFKQNFIQRNRLIAGLAKGVLVAEAAEKSGALITAHFALEQGRSVMAVPGPIFSPYSGGTNSLLREGARIVTSAEDVIDELSLKTMASTALTDATLMNEKEKNILKHLDEPRSVDELVKKLSIPAADIISCLSMLELRGMAKNIGGKWTRI